MKKLNFIKLLTLLFAGTIFVHKAAFSQQISVDRPKVGLVLSGGGARGAAHVGVLKVLEENNVPIDYIAGTSFGAIVGGLYASGYTADELEKILENIDWEQTLSDSAPRNKKPFRRKKEDDDFLIKLKVGFDDGSLKLPTGLITPNNLRLTLADLVSHTVAIQDFKELPIPFSAVATNLENGEAVILNQGNLASSMVASMTVPALFPPVLHEDKLLVDGGIANNIPVSVAREMGADIFIVVDISEDLLKKEDITSFANVLDQLTMLQSNTAAQRELSTLTENDIFIRPDLSGIGFVDFENAIDAVPRGVNAANDNIQKIKQYALTANEWQQYLNAKNITRNEEVIVNVLKIENSSKFSDELIRERLSQTEGTPLDVSVLSSDLTSIYATGIFEEVGYDLDKTAEGNQLTIIAKDREDGEDYLRFGLSLQENFEGESAFQMSVGFTNLALNDRGGEWQVLFDVGDQVGFFAEVYQPLTLNDDIYLYSNIGRRKITRNVGTTFETLDILSSSKVSRAHLQIGAGFNFSNIGTARIGLNRSLGSVTGQIGDNRNFEFDRTSLNADLLFDTLDNTSFPKEGINLEASYSHNLNILGGEKRANRFQFSSYAPFTFGRNTIGLKSQLYTTFNGYADEVELYPLGGFMDLSGFYTGQLTGHHAGSLSAIFYRNISGGPRYLGETPLYVGGTLEAGNIWQSSEDIGFNSLRWSSSLFVGADTIIGPVYLGGGLGSKGRTSAFLYVGQIF